MACTVILCDAQRSFVGLGRSEKDNMGKRGLESESLGHVLPVEGLVMSLIVDVLPMPYFTSMQTSTTMMMTTEATVLERRKNLSSAMHRVSRHSGSMLLSDGLAERSLMRAGTTRLQFIQCNKLRPKACRFDTSCDFLTTVRE